MFFTLILVPLLVLGELNGADRVALGDRLAEIFNLIPDGSEYSYLKSSKNAKGSTKNF